MKSKTKSMKILEGLVLIVVLAFKCSSAYAVTLPFEDGFENIAIGDYPDENGWQNLFSGVSAYVSDQAAHSGSRSFRLESYSTWSRTDYVSLPELPDRLSYEVSVYPDPAPPIRAMWIGFPEAFGNQGPFYNRFNIQVSDGSAGTVVFTKGVPGSQYIDVGEFTVGDWVTVRADLDFTSLTANLWLNGELAVTNVAITPKEFEHTGFGHVTLSKFGATEYNWSGGGTGVFYIDDVSLVPGAATIEAAIDIDPDTLNLNSKGKWITCYIELPEAYDVDDIDVSKMLLDEQVPAELRPAEIGDYDDDGVPDLMVKFDRSAVKEILEVGNKVEITVTGELTDGTPFEGIDTIRIIDEGGEG